MIDDKYDSASSGFPYQQSWAKRNGFSDALLAFIWLVTAFFLFQIVAAIAGVILVFALQTDPAGSVDLGNAMSLFSENLRLHFFREFNRPNLFLGTGHLVFLPTAGAESESSAFSSTKVSFQHNGINWGCYRPHFSSTAGHMVFGVDK